MNSVDAAQVLVDALIANGVGDFVLSPGSRSAPLAYALAAAEAADQARLHVRLDERGAGFFALGIAKSSGQPVALVCTSGTAVANYHPAVLEADLARVPLILLTADRPAELRGTLASQTINQVGIFGDAVRATWDIPTPDDVSVGGASQQGTFRRSSSAARCVSRPRSLNDATDDYGSLHEIASWAVATAMDPDYPGPVHLNLQYREPLHPSVGRVPAVGWCIERRTELVEVTTVQRFEMPLGAEQVPRPAINPYLPGNPARTIVIAGDGAGPVARQLAEVQGWPLLAEPTSGALGGPNQVSAYRYLLPLLAELPDTSPQQAIVFGRPTLNRAVVNFLANPDVAVTVVAPGSEPWPDAWRNTARFGPALNQSWFEPTPNSPTPGSAAGSDAVRSDANQNTRSDRTAQSSKVSPENPSGSGRATTNFLARWQLASKIAGGIVHGITDDAAIANDGGLAHAPAGPLAVARNIVAALHPGDVLVVGASNPIRDLDLVVPDADEFTILANRGVAGIDGTIATALGVATTVGRGALGAFYTPPRIEATDPKPPEPPSVGRVGSQTRIETTVPYQSERYPVTRLYLGDLAFWHDASSLLLGYGETRPQLQIIVANDAGGSIFTSLEHGEWAELGGPANQMLCRVFTTEQLASIEPICQGYGVAYTPVARLSELQRALAHPKPGVEVVEVKLNGQSRRLLHRHLGQRIGDAVTRALTNESCWQVEGTRGDDGERGLFR